LIDRDVPAAGVLEKENRFRYMIEKLFDHGQSGQEIRRLDGHRL
jgi:hypothetical protein